jgi:hypothetical protein
MTPSTNGTNVAKTQRSVFDVNKFENILLVKEYAEPPKPASLEEALSAVGNDQTKLLDILYAGLRAAAREAAYNDLSGFRVIDEDGEPGEVYEGKPADPSVEKLVKGAVLTMAKLQAGGSWESKTADEKRALKVKAAEFIRSNPAMLASFAG